MWGKRSIHKGVRISQRVVCGQSEALEIPGEILVVFIKMTVCCMIVVNMDSKVINIDPEILGGTPVFNGTRVPIESLFDHLEGGVSLDEFLDDFPTVTREQAIEVLGIAGEVLTSNKFELIYETIT